MCIECSIKYIRSAQDDRRFGSIFLFIYPYRMCFCACALERECSPSVVFTTCTVLTTHWIPKQQCAAAQGFTRASTSLKAPRATPCRSRIWRLTRRAENPQICPLILRHSPLINVLTTGLPTRSKLFISVGSIFLSAHSSPNSFCPLSDQLKDSRLFSEGVMEQHLV